MKLFIHSRLVGYTALVGQRTGTLIYVDPIG